MPLNQAFKILGRPELLTKEASVNEEDYSFSDRNATFRSFVTAHVKQADVDTIRHCVEHADFWGIRDECEKAIQKLAEWKAPEIPEDAYALVQQHGEQSVRKYAAYDAGSTFDAAIAFHENKAKYPLSWRKEAAVRLLSKAARYNVPLPEYVENGLHKSAGFGFPTKESVEEAMVCRLNHTKTAQAEVGDRLSTLLEHMIDNQQLRYDEGFVKQAVNALEQFDATTGLTSRYDSDVSLPEELLATTTNELEKLAGISKRAVELVNGRTVDIEDLTKEALSAIDPGLAKMAQDELIDVLPTLPKGDADLLFRLTE